jgi:raffinose/stachyose/melibiose transport system permease protein
VTDVVGTRHRSLAWLVLPALVFFTAFGIIPLIGVLALSFTTWDGIGEITPAGFANWGSVLTDPGLPHALGVTFLVMALSWLVQTPVSILIGVFIAGGQRYRAVLAVLFFLPLLLSSAAIAIAYKALLDPNFGVGVGLGVPLLVQNWLGEPVLAVGVVVFVVSWQFIPFHSLVYQGGVRQIPVSLYEAARIDGAGIWREFRHVTLPLLAPTFLFVGIITSIGYLQIFAEPYVMTRGGPLYATTSITLLMYQQGFRWWNLGSAAAIAFVLFALIIIATGLQEILRRRRSA